MLETPLGWLVWLFVTFIVLPVGFYIIKWTIKSIIRLLANLLKKLKKVREYI